MEDLQRLYPIGIQTFSKIREGNYLYIDKTEYVYRMTHSASSYMFLSRPRRFGKSLLTSTLHSYFSGRKDLFHGLAMEKLEKEWTEYPVLHFDMSTAKHADSEQLLQELNLKLYGYEQIYGRLEEEVNPNQRLMGLIKRAYEQTGKKVVVLIDEYDAPLLDVVHERENLDEKFLLKLCTKKISSSGKTIRLFSRCGIFYVKDKEMSVNMMIGRAKLAKKYIEDEYVQPYKVYDSSMQTAYIDKAEIAGELAEGIAKGELQVYYQPVVDVKTGQIASAEALIRWHHSEKGFLSPGFFIPALEESGHISELDDYVIHQVSDFLMDRYHAGKNVVPVSVNLSWMDFYDEKIMEDILDKCKNNDLKEKLIRLEVTETSYAAMGESRNSILESFRTEGVKIMMDDFGTGYSSFGMLQQYNFDIMKIDMSFIRQIETNPKTKSMLRFLIDMAHEMGIYIVAEGVETEVQADFLKKSHCDYIQGYYYYRPIPQEEFRKLLDEM